MKKWMIGIVAFVMIAALVGQSVITKAAMPTPTPPKTPTSKPLVLPSEIDSGEYKVEYEAIASESESDWHRDKLKVTVEGPVQDLRLEFDRLDAREGGYFGIYGNYFKNGKATAYVFLSQAWTFVPSVPYILTISDYTGEIHYQKIITFKGEKPEIKDVALETKCSDNYCDINEVYIKISNEGDLPAVVNRMKIYIGSERRGFDYATTYTRGLIVPAKGTKVLKVNIEDLSLEKEKQPLIVNIETYRRTEINYESEFPTQKRKEREAEAPGFETLYAIAGLLIVMYLMRKRVK